MEELKKYEEICEPDARQQLCVIFDRDFNSFRSLTLKDVYEIADSIKLHLGVPEDIRDQFEKARNLYVYSWFYYPFNVTAQLQALTTTEFALRLKANSRRRSGFQDLLRRAVRLGWLSDEGFSRIEFARLKAISNSSRTNPEQRAVQTYCDALIETLPRFRNELAHGSITLHNQGALYLLICAELINQLFEMPNEGI